MSLLKNWQIKSDIILLEGDKIDHLFFLQYNVSFKFFLSLFHPIFSPYWRKASENEKKLKFPYEKRKEHLKMEGRKKKHTTQSTNALPYSRMTINASLYRFFKRMCTDHILPGKKR